MATKYHKTTARAGSLGVSSKWLTMQGAAIYCGVTTRTLDTWQKAGCFKTANVTPMGGRGRRLVDRESLDRFIESYVGAPVSICGVNKRKEAV